ncbi:hypothetical protein QW71_27945 [Paenibacillus sp. IHB B 3415]|uniref:class I SAM-dependent methyltransferase n=1 Tax=Paenibacillus sp. IHB B 3415 TaxID=867080 RepID=UPI0005753B0D|nr:class I SAM-dependent methyltransferase [Paenibacillus sp. IHB B 3415]KHL92661.1 hypothetical protein QW71_27945 [Paenibacillus sp. IHB B 3415]
MPEKNSDPASIMQQIRLGVRKQEILKPINNRVEDDITINNSLHMDSGFNEEFQNMNIKINRLVHRITPNIPVAFLEPRLVSRYKILNKFVTPIRKFGNRFFSKWYMDTLSNQQKYLNNDLWFGLNSSIEVLVDQSRLIAQLANKVSTLENETVHLKSEVEQLKIEGENNNVVQEQYNKFIDEFNSKYKLEDFQYSDFAKQFSASGDEVKGILKQYLRFFKPTDTIIDIGCGKGFFLELLTENNLKGIGIDTDPQLIEECKSKNLEAYVCEGSQYLSKQNDMSIDAVFFAHVIEHLTVPQKISFFRLCHQKLKKGGVLVIETPNTTSGYVLNNLYYLDPTHERPLLPEALKHLAKMTGFNVINSYLSGEIGSIVDGVQYYNYSLILEK